MTVASLFRSRRGATEVPERDRSCPACGGEGRPLRLVVDPGCQLIRCRTCRTQYLRRLPSTEASSVGDGVDSEYWEQYKFALYDSDDVRRGYDERYELAFDMVGPAVPSAASVLDVGCGVGNFLDWARRRGLRGLGIEVDGVAIQTARDRGLAVGQQDELSEWLGEHECVDVLTLWDVIEHVFEPDALVAQVIDRLRPGGALLLETPDAAFPIRAVLRGLHRLTGGRVDLVGVMYYWEHKVYFTEAGLRSLLARHGCDIVQTRRLTSPRAKMQRTFSYLAGKDRDFYSRMLAVGWPAAERFFRVLGWGNKLVVVARRRPDAPGTNGRVDSGLAAAG
ncbi:class I SAM-dependent methyltransferase [Geodermatophilus sp. URMC 60]